jgi:hypothetical protein
MKVEPRDRPQEIILGEFCIDWFKIKKPQLRLGTMLLYKNTVHRFRDYFGPGILLSRITPIEAEKFITGLKLLARRESLSNASKYRVFKNCRTMLNDAVT